MPDPTRDSPLEGNPTAYYAPAETRAIGETTDPPDHSQTPRRPPGRIPGYELLEEIGVEIEITGVIYETDAVIDSNGDHWEAKVFKASTKDTPSLPEPDKIIGVGWFNKTEVVALHEAGLLADYAVKDFEHLGWL